MPSNPPDNKAHDIAPAGRSDCADIEDLESLFSGQLDTERLTAIEDHLESCHRCQNELERIETNHSDTRRIVHEAGAGPWDPVAQRFVEVLMRDSELADCENPSTGPAAAMPSIPGYEVSGLLGRGGMGCVYDAVHLQFQRPVAVKVLPEASRAEPERLARFTGEMAAIGQLDHPGIVQAYDAAEYNGLHYLVMERVDGCTGSEISRVVGQMEIADACEIVRQTATALQHAYENGLVHRDIKPSNLMVSMDGTVKLLDLGLARLNQHSDVAQDELTATGQIMGTIDYMSPEQAAGKNDIGIASDIYSLGTTLYRFLGGRVPFYGAGFETVLQKLYALATENPPSLSSLRPDISAELDAITLRMMSKRPEDRYAQPRDVVDALRPFCRTANLETLCHCVARRVANPSPDEAAIETARFAAENQPTLGRIDDGKAAAISIPQRDARPIRTRKTLRSVGVIAILAAAIGWLAIATHTPSEVNELNSSQPLTEPAESNSIEGVSAGGNLESIVTVTTLSDDQADDGLVTLREAIQMANENQSISVDAPSRSSPPTTTILFDTPLKGTIELKGGPLTITGDVAVQGPPPSADLIKIDANGQSRVIDVVGSDSKVSLTRLTITGGKTVENFHFGSGAGIRVANGAILFVDDCLLWNNHATGYHAEGGGICGCQSNIRLRHSTVQYNSAFEGGGVRNYGPGADLSLSDCRILDNEAEIGGGISIADQATAEINDTEIGGNRSTTGKTAIIGDVGGGGIFGYLVDLKVLRSSITENRSMHAGAGIYTSGGSTVNLKETVVENNRTIAGERSDIDGDQVDRTN